MLLKPFIRLLIRFCRKESSLQGGSAKRVHPTTPFILHVISLTSITICPYREATKIPGRTTPATSPRDRLSEQDVCLYLRFQKIITCYFSTKIQISFYKYYYMVIHNTPVKCISWIPAFAGMTVGGCIALKKMSFPRKRESSPLFFYRELATGAL
jgi:hypothetical protein